MEISSDFYTSLACEKEWERVFYHPSLGLMRQDDVPSNKRDKYFRIQDQIHEFENLESSNLTERRSVSRYYMNLNESISTQCTDTKESEQEEVYTGNTKPDLYAKFKNSNQYKVKSKPIRAFLLTPDQMIEGYLRGRLCLSCDSTSHPMPKCPNQVFVCPNCHLQGHRGENCTEQCRFCKKWHPGRCILDCIQQTIRNMKLTVHDKKIRNFSNSSDPCIVENEFKDETSEQDVLDPKNFDLTSRPDNAWGRTIYIKGIPVNMTDEEISSRLNGFVSSGYITKVQLFSKRDHAFVTLSSKLSAAELISKKIVMEGKLLNLQWRKSGGYNKTSEYHTHENNLLKNTRRIAPQLSSRECQLDTDSCHVIQSPFERQCEQHSPCQVDFQSDCKSNSLDLETPISLILQGLEMNILTFNETIELVQKLLMKSNHKA